MFKSLLKQILTSSILMLMLFILMATKANDGINPPKTLEQKTERCQALINELAVASGLKAIEIPKIEVVDVLPNSNLAIAMYNNIGLPTISIHKWTYDICMEDLGKDSINGLAFILAHELAHVSKKHLERQLFYKKDTTDQRTFIRVADSVIKDRSSLDSFALSIALAYRGLSEKYNIRKNEAEADLFAGFTAYLAGYNTKEAAPKFLQRAYEDFELDTKKGKYVALVERQEIARKTAEKLDTLIRVFEMGNLLSISGQNDIATHCYKYINQFYSSPALLNNIGLSMILEVSEETTEESLPYTLPFTIKTNLITGNVMRGDFSLETIIAKLEEAISYFKRVQISHPHSYEAYLNHSIAEYLIYTFRKQTNKESENEGDYLDYAKTYAYKAKSAIASNSESDKALSDVYLMLSILEHAGNNQEQAKIFFQLSADKNANNNLLKPNEFIAKEEMDSTTEPNNQSCDEEALVFGKEVSQLFTENENKFDIDISLGYINEKDSLRFYVKEYESGVYYNISILHHKVEMQYYSVFETNDKYPDPSPCGVSNKNSIDTLEQVYGPIQNILQSSSGHYVSFNQEEEELEDAVGNTWLTTDGVMFYSNNSNLIDRRYMFRRAIRQ